MSVPSISVIVPCFNAERYLRHSLNSLLQQTFIDFEVIVVDDASTDESASIAQEISRQDHRVRYFRNARNMGVIYSRNAALSHARGQYIALQDADDISNPDRFELQFSVLNEHPEIAICGSHTEIIDAGGEVVAYRKYPLGSRSIVDTALCFNPFAATSVMVRKDILESVGGFGDPEREMVEDYWAWLRILAIYPGENVDAYLIRYREHDSDIRATVRRKLWNTIKCKWNWIFHRRFFSFLALIIFFGEALLLLAPQVVTYRIFSFLRYRKV